MHRHLHAVPVRTELLPPDPEEPPVSRHMRNRKMIRVHVEASRTIGLLRDDGRLRFLPGNAELLHLALTGSETRPIFATPAWCNDGREGRQAEQGDGHVPPVPAGYDVPE